MPRPQSSRSATLPAPVGGWDTREAIADMPADHAVVLDNWFPSTDKVTLRSGYTAWATGLGAAVESLLPYAPQAGSQKLFAAAGGSIFDVTTAGAVGAAVVTGLTSARWQSVQLGTAGGQFLFACNGADTPRTYDGAAWANTTISGPTVANLVWCNLHQRRLWVGEKNSLTAWYLPVNTLGGAASSFSLAAVARLGGSITGMATWSRDGGAGPEDYAVFVTSEGEVVIYAGTDPATAADWALQGVFRIGRPIGRRCLAKLASDLIIITQDGVVALSAVLPLDRTQAETGALSQRINRAVNTAARTYGTVFGWEAFLYPRGQMALVNVPQTSETAHQYVVNTLTGAWCRFTGIPALCWALLDEAALFGGPTGTVWAFDTVRADNGAAITGHALQAFNYLGGVGQKKAFKLVQPLFEASADPQAAVDLAVDFDTGSGQAAMQSSPVSASISLWGVATWGPTGSAKWGSGLRMWQGWRGVRGLGRAAAPRVRVSASGAQVSWVATSITWIPGGQV